MNTIRPLKRGLLVWTAVLLIAAASAQAQITNFSQDVNTAINNGLGWLHTVKNVYVTSGSSAGDAAGLAALALLEKRTSAAQNAPGQGYIGASAADQLKIDNIITYVIGRVNNGFYAYRTGGAMMALSVYILSGGPNPAALPALNKAFDQSTASINLATWSGYWCYSDPTGCRDSSTTQFIMSGLAATKSVYSSALFADAVRLARLNAVVAKTRTAYATYGTSDGLSATEKGHGYNQGNVNSLQQTAAGAWIQLVGGADLHDVGEQGYLEWLRNRYNYQTINYAGGGWQGQSYGYYMWSSSKAYDFLDNSGALPVGSELSTASLGVLPSGSSPLFSGRLMHLDPAAVSRPAVFGPGSPAYYASIYEGPRWYFDYAYTLINRLEASGHFATPNGNWGDNWLGSDDGRVAEQAYHILVLEHSVGGGCVDTDGDGVCDGTDNCPLVVNANQLDADGDGIGDACDRCPNQAGPSNNG